METINTITLNTGFSFWDLEVLKNNNDFLIGIHIPETVDELLDMRKEDIKNHALRVGRLTLALAKKVGFEKEELEQIYYGALLHDIGKIYIPDHILSKPGPLNKEEREIIHQHPIYALEILTSLPFLSHAIEIPYCHHEKWDGTGYPRGLRNYEIPLVARIFSVVDVWDALTSDRPYRKAWPKKKALNYIIEQSGKHFDPRVVEEFNKMILIQENKIIEDQN